MKKTLKTKKVKKPSKAHNKPLILNMGFDDAMKRLIKAKPLSKNLGKDL